MSGNEKLIIQAFTGSGLVASIVAHHLIQNLDLKEKGYITSSAIPSVGIVRNGVIQRPVRLFENDQYLLVFCEIGIANEKLDEFIEALYTWYNKLNPTSVAIVGALPTGRPSDATNLKYVVVASDSLTHKFINNKGIWTMPTGAVYGSVALSLMEAKRYGLSAFAILSHCIATIPDYLAAKTVVEVLQNILEDKIPIDNLEKSAEELKKQLINRSKTNGENNYQDDKYYDPEGYYYDDDNEDYSKFV